MPSLTVLPDVAAKHIVKELDEDWDKLAAKIINATTQPCTSKKQCQLILGAKLGPILSPKESYRHDGNIVYTSILILDYDADDSIHMKVAADRLDEHNINYILYPSWSWSVDKPKWRLVLPLKERMSSPETDTAIAHHAAYIDQISDKLNITFDKASRNLSQSYFVGLDSSRVKQYPSPIYNVDGLMVDEVWPYVRMSIVKTEDPVEVDIEDLLANADGEHLRIDAGHYPMREAVKSLGRKLRDGDGRREFIMNYVGGLCGKGVLSESGLRKRLKNTFDKFFDMDHMDQGHVRNYEKMINDIREKELLKHGVTLQQFEDELKKRKAGGRSSLQKLMKRYLFVSVENKYFDTKNKILLSPPAFSNINLQNFNITTNTSTRGTAIEDFHSHPDADDRTVDGIAWLPVEEDVVYLNGNKYANTYRLPLVRPVAGDVSMWLELCRHIYGEHYHQIMNHMAYTIQYPEQKIRWQVLGYGPARTGKSMSVLPVIRIMGAAGATVSNDDLSAGWGDVYAGKKVLLFEEILQPENRHFYNTIKTKLANHGVEPLNIKGAGILYQPNLYSIYMFSNHDDAVRLDSNDGKLLVFKTPQHKLDVEFYRELGDLINTTDEYIEHVYHYLLNYDVSGFNPNAPVDDTDAAREMIENSVPDNQRRLLEMIEDEEPPFDVPYIKFEEIKRSLRAQDYRFTDRGISYALDTQGYRAYRGTKYTDGKAIHVRFWARRTDELDDMHPAELYEEYISKQ